MSEVQFNCGSEKTELQPGVQSGVVQAMMVVVWECPAEWWNTESRDNSP